MNICKSLIIAYIFENIFQKGFNWIFIKTSLTFLKRRINMGAVRYFVISICLLFFVLVNVNTSNSETLNNRLFVNENNLYNVWEISDDGEAFVVKESNNFHIKLAEPCKAIGGGGAFGGPGFDTMNFNMPAPIVIDDIEPTTTVELSFNNDNMPSEDELFKRYGDDIEIITDPKDDNRTLVLLPALTVEESHDIICALYELFFPPLLIIDRRINNTFVMMNIELIKYTNLPYLQVR